MKRTITLMLLMIFMLLSATMAHAIVTKVAKTVPDYSGMGLMWVRDNRGFKVVTIMKDSPLADVLQVGDVLTTINGVGITSATGRQVLDIMADNPGTDVRLEYLRGSQRLVAEFKSRENEITLSNIKVTSIPLGKITIFLTEQFFYSNLNTSDEVRSGDIFLIFDGDKLIGMARVREASYHHTELIMIRFFNDVVTRHKDRYRLVYYKHAPIAYTPGN